MSCEAVLKEALNLWHAMSLDWDASDTIALLALVAAVWAGWSARVSANEAKRANAQAMYQERRAVFDAFLDLCRHLEATGQSPDVQTVGRFYHHSHTAFFCFVEPLAQEIEAHYHRAHELADFARANPGFPPLPPELKAVYEQLWRDSPVLLDKLRRAVRVD